MQWKTKCSIGLTCAIAYFGPGENYALLEKKQLEVSYHKLIPYDSHHRKQWDDYAQSINDGFIVQLIPFYQRTHLTLQPKGADLSVDEIVNLHEQGLQLGLDNDGNFFSYPKVKKTKPFLL